MPTDAGGGHGFGRHDAGRLRGGAARMAARGGRPFLLPFNPNNWCGAERLPFSRRSRTPPNVVWGVRLSTAGLDARRNCARMALPVCSDTATRMTRYSAAGGFAGAGSARLEPGRRLPRRRRVELADVRRVLPRRAVPMMSRGLSPPGASSEGIRACSSTTTIAAAEPGLPADGQPAAVGVVTVGQADGRAVAGDVAGMAFNARAVTIAARSSRRRPLDGPPAAPASAWPAGRRPSDRPGEWLRAGPTSTNWRAACRAGTRPGRPSSAVQGWRPSGAGGGRARTGRRGRKRSTTRVF